MKASSSSINLSQSLYNALRSNYLNRPIVMKPEGMTNGLPDIAAIPQGKPEKVIQNGE
ncbi:hypothetical protein [Falsirhodobacter sp. 1013]|uniref:hypothetical protein n=1 Tax=Falsirhodobacter sp. 1013 TaxID=3417566 RepID=UPI003EB93226